MEEAQTATSTVDRKIASRMWNAGKSARELTSIVFDAVGCVMLCTL